MRQLPPGIDNLTCTWPIRYHSMSSQLVQHSRMQRFIKFLHIFHIVTIPRNAISDHVQSRRKWEILLFFVASKNQLKITILHALCTVGGGVANNLNGASHLPHLAQSFWVLHTTSCNLTEGSTRRNITFAASIWRVPSLPQEAQYVHVPSDWRVQTI